MAILVFLLAMRCCGFLVKGASLYFSAKEDMQNSSQIVSGSNSESYFKEMKALELQKDQGKAGIALGVTGTVGLVWAAIKLWKKDYTGS